MVGLGVGARFFCCRVFDGGVPSSLLLLLLLLFTSFFLHALFGGMGGLPFGWNALGMLKCLVVGGKHEEFHRLRAGVESPVAPVLLVRQLTAFVPHRS